MRAKIYLRPNRRSSFATNIEAEIAQSTREAFHYSLAESRASYLSLGAGLALSFGQIGWDSAHGTVSTDQAAYRSMKAATLIGAGLTVDSTLLLAQQGALRGTLQGNLIVGAVVLIVDTSWTIYEYGGRGAFYHADFYEHLGGSISSVAVGGAAGLYVLGPATAAAAEFGPAAPVIGTGVSLMVGTGVGIVAYVGGRSATSWFVRTLWPELYRQFQQQQIEAVRALLSNRLESAQNLN